MKKTSDILWEWETILKPVNKKKYCAYDFLQMNDVTRAIKWRVILWSYCFSFSLAFILLLFSLRCMFRFFVCAHRIGNILYSLFVVGFEFSKTDTRKKARQTIEIHSLIYNVHASNGTPFTHGPILYEK